MSIQVWTLGAIVVSAVAFAWLESRFPYNPGHGLLRDGFWNDLVLYCFVQSYVLGVIIARLVAWLDTTTGFSRLHVVSGWSVPAQLAFFIVTHDLYIYLFHRWQHRSPVLWRLHEAHHSARVVDWLSGVRSHSLEILINQTVEFAPLVLLGASPTVIVLKGAVSAIWGIFIHSNIDARLGV
ncbi:MAG TPA: sterol desaturase family protein, partial [Gemmatimonadaceae bacterium]|nr:sterol desaturase family protein [Gemmatimonadaceae bacterium]